MTRKVVPEILDELDADDPRAQRSRRDLRLINFVMGNERWISRKVRAHQPKKIIELGAGEGHLSNRLASVASVEAYDLSPQPVDLLANVHWHEGDIFESIDALQGDAFVACLVLHHFEEPALRRIARAVSHCNTLIFSEPWRASWPHMFGKTAWPFINDVTRHDMHVSIDAGFVPGELPEIFGSDWNWSEQVTLAGALRTIGRKSP